MQRNAFTMIELVFVVVIVGLFATYGIEFLAQSYRHFIFSNINNKLQSNSSMALNIISSRLQYRIKDSVIVRDGNTSSFKSLSNANGTTYNVLEWVASDIDNFRGVDTPNWSAIIDLELGDENFLVSPKTNTDKIDNLISILSHKGSKIDDSALYFVGSNSNINGYGWDGVALTNQNAVMHPISSNEHKNQFIPVVGSFSGVDIYEYYKLSWSANAISMQNYDSENKIGTLMFHQDYQPWKGENFYTDAKKFIIMENVSTFKASAVGSSIYIQICVKSNLVSKETYSVCKEKIIY